MAATVQCEHCGAVLGPDDQFCGECGAPRPAGTSAPSTVLSSATPSGPPEPTPAPAVRPRSISEGWRTAARIIAILSVAVAIALCGLGLIVGFLRPQAGQAAPQDMIVGLTILCFCPGFLALVFAGALWLFLVRRK